MLRSLVRPGVRGRLVLVLLMVLVPLLVTEVVVYSRRFEAQKAAELQANLELARAVAKTFESVVQDVLRTELSVGIALTASPPLPPREQERLLAAVHADHPAVRALSWLTPDGVVVASSRRSYLGINLRDRSYVQAVLGGQPWAVSELVMGRGTNRWGFLISRGIRDAEGRLLGVVAAALEPDRLDSLLAIHRLAGAGISLLDNTGMHVFRHPRTEYTPEQRNWLRLYPEAVGRALRGEDVLVTLPSASTGKPRLGAFVPVPPIGWVAVAGRDEAAVMQGITRALAVEAGLLVGVALLGLAAAVALARPIAHGIVALRQHAGALARGDRPSPIRLAGSAELHDLATGFTDMAEAIQSREQALQQANSELEKTNVQLEEAIAALQQHMEEREQAESALRESEERFRALAENLHSAVALIDERGRFSIVNAAFLRLFDLPPNSDILNVNSRDWAQWQVFDEHGVLLDVDAHPVRRAALTRTAVRNQLVAIKSPSRADLQWLLVSAEPLVDSEGALHRLICTYYDITERKRAEAALQQKSAEIAEAQRVAHVGSWYWDATTDVTTGSGELFRIYGLDPTIDRFPDFREQDGRLYPHDSWERLNAAVHETVRIGVGYALDVEALRNGERIWIATRSEPVRDVDGRIVGLRGTVQDITARKQAERRLLTTLAEKEAALATNTALLREVHHRVKNNLQMLCDLMYLQMEAMPHPEEHQDLQDAYGRIYAIARLHEQLYQSMDGGRIRLEEYLRRLVGGFENLFSGIPIKVEAAETGLALDLDRAIHVGLIVNELITNAVKHAFPKGQSGAVVVEVRSVGEQVQIQVRDNGKGLPPDLVAENSKTLGLRTVYILAKRLDAIVDVQNQRGATFTLTFPLHADEPVGPRVP